MRGVWSQTDCQEVLGCDTAARTVIERAKCAVAVIVYSSRMIEKPPDPLGFGRIIEAANPLQYRIIKHYRDMARSAK